VYLNGYHGDCCDTFEVGSVSDEDKHLIQISLECVEKAIQICGPGVAFSLIGTTIESYVSINGYVSMSCCTGHGIGREFHNYPIVLSICNDYPGTMQTGMAFTIEPIIKEGLDEVFLDGWAVKSRDKNRGAQHEHTVLITETGVEVLTRKR